MTLIRRPAPLAELVSLRDAMDRLFDERFFHPLWTSEGERAVVPALDLFTTSDAVIARVALPGVKPGDVDITVTDDQVTVTGTFKEATETTEAGYLHRELSRGSFTRSFTTPTTIKAADAKATFADGLLTLTLPKTEQAKPTHVKIQAT